MPKIVIKKDELPPISADDEGYNLRIRLVSQDRNRVSFWTPLLTVEAPAVTEIPCLINIVNTGTGKLINLSWDDPNNSKEFDIYVRWRMTPSGPLSDWTYKGSTFSNTWSLLDPGAHTFIVAVQKVSYPKIYAQRYALFTSDEINL